MCQLLVKPLRLGDGGDQVSGRGVVCGLADAPVSHLTRDEPAKLIGDRPAAKRRPKVAPDIVINLYPGLAAAAIELLDRCGRAVALRTSRSASHTSMSRERRPAPGRIRVDDAPTSATVCLVK